MYTVLVVDDEEVVHLGIKEFLERSELNIGQVLTAGNGYEALDYLRMGNIDLVITDIHMNGMNGIELIESMQVEKPETPVIVISAYDEFQYAQRCVRLGARDYLVKPVHLPQLVAVVERALSEQNERYKLVLENAIKVKFSMMGMTSLRTYLLNELIAGSLGHMNEHAELFEQMGVSFTGSRFSLMAIELLWEHAGDRLKAYSLRDRNLFKYAAINIMEETLSDYNAITFYGQGSRLMAILQFGDEGESSPRKSAASRLNLLGHTLSANISQYLQLKAVIGISPTGQDWQAIPDCCRQAFEALKWHGLYQNHYVFFADDFHHRKFDWAGKWQEKSDKLVEWMKVGKKRDEVREAVEIFVEDISVVFDNNGIPLSIAYRVYAALLDMKEALGGRHDQMNPLTYFVFPMSGAELKQRLTSYLLEAADSIHAAMLDHDHALVQQACLYIRESFRLSSLKIHDIADDVHVSPNYLSYLFKNITGDTVWEYVTRMRMEEAKQLLMHTKKKRYEIAYEVGYESPEHFSRVFKQYFGVTPNTIRG